MLQSSIRPDPLPEAALRLLVVGTLELPDLGPSVALSPVAAGPDLVRTLVDGPWDGLLLDGGDAQACRAVGALDADLRVPPVILLSDTDQPAGIRPIPSALAMHPRDVDPFGLAVTLARARDPGRISAELERRVANLTTFVRVASHDLAAPLRKIGMLNEFLIEDAEERLINEDLQMIDQSNAIVRDTQELLTTLRNFARTLEPLQARRPCQVSELVDRALSVLPGDPRARVTIVKDGLIWGDPSLLSVVLKNLIANGLTYADPETGRVTLSLAEQDGQVTLTVMDTGVGIAADQIDRVFEPGYRLHHDEDVPGSGFGLAICREILTAHGGAIHAASVEGQGTTVTISLPGT